MSLAEVLPDVRSLSRAEKLRLLALLAHELADAEERELLQAGASYPIWSPYESFGAAQTLLTALAADEGKS